MNTTAISTLTKPFPGSPKEYANAISIVLKSGYATLEHINTANHLALERKYINLEQFQAAARVLAAEILKR